MPCLSVISSNTDIHEISSVFRALYLGNQIVVTNRLLRNCAQKSPYSSSSTPGYLWQIDVKSYSSRIRTPCFLWEMDVGIIHNDYENYLLAI